MAEELPNNDSEEFYEEEPSVLRKVLIISIGIFMLLLFLSYFLLGPHTFDILNSMVASSRMSSLTVEGKGFSVVFDNSTYNELKDYYYSSQKTEFKACLGGNVTENSYLVDSLYFPEQSASFAQVNYMQCDAGTIASLHSHPHMRCIASKQDFISFDEFRKTSPDAVMMVMCEADRFFVYK